MSLDALPLVIEPAQLTPLLGEANLLVLDLSQPQTHTQAHVPGAIFLPFQHLMAGIAPAPGKLPSVDHLSQLFSAIGLTPETHVVAYDDEGGGWAGRLIWTLDMIGHQRYSYLNGGIHAWIADQQPVETEQNAPQPTEYVANIVGDMSVEKEEIIANLGGDQMVIWDARSPGEYAGTKVNAAKAGHIPGARNYEWTRAMDRDNALRIRDLDAIKSELSAIGITEDKTIITHCQSHHRSGFTYLLGKVLGFPNIKAYPGSWGEWGNSEDTPVELEAHP